MKKLTLLFFGLVLLGNCLAQIPASIPHPEKMPNATGHVPGDIDKGSFYEPTIELKTIDYYYKSWTSFPNENCTCTHSLWVKVERWESTGFLGAVNIWDYGVNYFWHYECSCSPGGACGEHGQIIETSSKWILYDEEKDVPKADKDIMGIIGTVASIASLVVALL
jgi:hypothetical protein